ncbi:carbamate kinase [Candidatus Woesearchaeota archaeon]|nr:carbamate kinase [Candidatus Woesearchaeota archaeon]
MKRIAIIALGGNALIKKGEKASVYNQFKHVKKALESILPIIKKGYKIVITYGNGPQIGNIILNSETTKKTYNIPMDVAGAQSQGEIGYIIQQTLENLLRKNKIKKTIATVLTQVEVDKNDPALKIPTKPVGSFYSRLKASRLKKKYPLNYDAGRGYRRVVPSPEPLNILEVKVIQRLLEDNIIVIAVGGGGVPVVKTKYGYKGIEAVIDKDLASACLAKALKADELIILTSVDNAYLNFNTRSQYKLQMVSLKEAQVYLKQNQFAEGSMKPKIESAIKFLKFGGNKVVITSPEKFGKNGTLMVK